MRISQTESRLVLSDVPRALWVLGLVFVASGTFVLSVPLWSVEWHHFSLWEKVAIVVIGLGHLAGGTYSVVRPAATRTQLDRVSGVGAHRVRRFVPFAPAPPSQFGLDEVRTVEVVRSKDGDGDPMFQLRLWLTRSRSLWLQAQPSHGEAHAIEGAERVRRFLGLASRGEDR